MKHSRKITLILILMFFVAQLIGIFIANSYLPQTTTVMVNGVPETKQVSELPLNLTPPEDTNPTAILWQLVISLLIAVSVIFVLMKFRLEIVLRIWFFLAITIGLTIAITGISLYLFKLPPTFTNTPMAFYLTISSLIIALALAIVKVFQRNIIIHNLTELLIYPGIATIFVPIMNLQTISLFLIIISAYDIYAVWHAGFMQKMAKYQIEKVRVFSGFFIPYVNPKDKKILKQNETSKTKKKVAVNIAILGGGDVIFPIILAGVVLRTWGILPALIIAITSTIALSLLLIYSEKGKFYPAMPFITAGCMVGLGLAYILL